MIFYNPIPEESLVFKEDDVWCFTTVTKEAKEEILKLLQVTQQVSTPPVREGVVSVAEVLFNS